MLRPFADKSGLEDARGDCRQDDVARPHHVRGGAEADRGADG